MNNEEKKVSEATSTLNDGLGQKTREELIALLEGSVSIELYLIIEEENRKYQAWIERVLNEVPANALPGDLDLHVLDAPESLA